MKYGELQAVIQLSICINIGIYALKDIAIHYLADQRRDLVSLRRFAGEKRESIKLIQDHIMKEDKEKQLDKSMGRLLSAWRKSSSLRDGYGNFIEMMVLGPGVMALTGLLLLFHSSHYYDQVVECGFVLLIYILYLPLAMMVYLNLMTRYVWGRSLVNEQKSIHDDLNKII